MALGLDFSPLDQRAQIYRDKALREKNKQQMVQSAAEGVVSVANWQQGIDKGIQSRMKYDSDVTTNAAANSYLADSYYKKVMGPQVERNKKRFLGLGGGGDIIEMDADIAQHEKETKSVIALADMQNKAMEMAQSQGDKFAMNTANTSEFEDVISGNVEVNNPNAIFRSILQEGSDGTGNPFLRVVPKDMSGAMKIAEVEAVKSLPPYAKVKEKVQTTVNQSGRAVTESEMRTLINKEYEDYIRAHVEESIGKSEYQANFGKWASEEYDGIPPRDAMQKYMNDWDYSSVFGSKVTSTTKSTKPIEPKEGDKSKLDAVEVDIVNDKYSHSDRPLYFNVDVDGEPSKIQITSEYKNDDGVWMVKGSAPDTDSFKKLYAQAVEDKGGELTSDEETAVFMKSMQVGKKKVIEKPLSELYKTGEFQRAAKKAKLNFRGLEAIDFEVKEDDWSQYLRK